MILHKLLKSRLEIISIIECYNSVLVGYLLYLQESKMAERSTSPQDWQSWEAVSSSSSPMSNSYTVDLESTNLGTSNTMYSQGSNMAAGPESPSKYVPTADEFQFLSTSSASANPQSQQSYYAQGNSGTGLNLTDQKSSV